MDNRVALKPNTLISINHRNYLIQKECGRGSHCIVYQAIYYDDLNCMHSLHIKEFYPMILKLERKEQMIVIPTSQQAIFNQMKQQFLNTYILHTKIQITPSMVNTSSHVFEYGIFNHTLYILLDAKEGISYANYQESTLHELLLNIKSLCEIIATYHSNGYLHLDIKAENIFLMSQTNHQLLLLDYDSVLQYPIQNPHCIQCYTKEYAAFEVRSRKYLQIGPWSDIYAIAVLLFYRLFQRFPTYDEHNEYVEYDFTSMQYASNIYSAKLYRFLQDFFHRCFTPIIANRYQNMSQLMPHLLQLIEEADLSKSHLLSSFYAYQPHFVGREQELNRLDHLLHQHKCVFIYGVGGIGKSELMKKYASLHQRNYHSIQLLVYQYCLKDLLLDDSILISQFYQDESESDEDYIQRKLAFLQSSMSEKDLILLDNFDCESDPYLIKLLQLPCHFIITSRVNHYDYDFVQLHLKAFDSFTQCHQLFQLYYPKSFTISEQKQLEAIYQLLEYHTMSITLLAKTMRESHLSLDTIYHKLDSIRGITYLNEHPIMHRKDDIFKKDSMHLHLKALFDLQAFSESEIEILASFAMLGALQIRMDLFCEWLNINSSDLNDLIKCGWIQQEQQRITLHQLIMDLVYDKYHTHPCITLHINLNTWYQQKYAFYQEKQIRNRILSQFIQRSQATHPQMQALLRTYLTSNCIPELAHQLLQMADCPQAQYLAHQTFIHVISHCFQFGESYTHYCDQLLNSFRFITGYLYQNIDSSKLCESLFHHCVFIRDTVDAISNDLMLLEEDEDDEINTLYDYLFLLIERIESLLDTASPSTQHQIYEGLIQLLSDRFTDLYFQSHYPSDDYILKWKASLNQSQDDSLDFDFDFVIDIDDCSKTYEDFGDEAMIAQDYQNAIHYYQQSFQYESNDCFIMDKLIQAYTSAKQYDYAYQLCLEKQKQFPLFAQFEEKILSDLAYHLHLPTQAQSHCEHYVTYAKKDWLESQNSDTLEPYIEALMFQHQLHQHLHLDCDNVHTCLDLYYKYPTLFSYTDGFFPFYAWYIQLLIDKNQYDEAYQMIMYCIFQSNHKNIWYALLSQMEPFHQALEYLLKAYFLQDNFQYQESLIYAKKGYEFALASQLSLLLAFAYHVLGEAYEDETDIKTNYQLQCDYVLLAQYMIKILACSNEKQCSIWQQVISKLESLNNYNQLAIAYPYLYQAFENSQAEPSEIFYWMHHQLYILYEYDATQAFTLAITCIQYLQTHYFTKEDCIRYYQNLADFFIFIQQKESAIECLLYAMSYIYDIEPPRNNIEDEIIEHLPTCIEHYINDSLHCLQKLSSLVDGTFKQKILTIIHSYQEKDVTFKH